jgi:hypothetical protein
MVEDETEEPNKQSGAQRTRWRWRTHVTFIPPLPGGRRAPAPRDR